MSETHPESGHGVARGAINQGRQLVRHPRLKGAEVSSVQKTVFSVTNHGCRGMSLDSHTKVSLIDFLRDDHNAAAPGVELELARSRQQEVRDTGF